MSAQTAVIVGVGNILFKDEGIGIYAAKYLEENYQFSSGVEVIDGGVLGFQLMTYYQSYDHVIILDTTSIKDKAGSVFNMPSDVLLGLGSYKQTAHEVEVVEMLEICSMQDSMADTHIIGMIPEDIESVSISLTQSMIENFSTMINEVLKTLKTKGFSYEKINDVSLESIIEAYANPSAARSA